MFQRSPRSFEELFRVWGSTVYRLCYHLAGHREMAEDLAQDVLLEAYRSLDSFEGRSTFSTWLFVIARRRWVKARRRGDREVQLSEEIENLPTLDPAWARVDRFELELAIQNLPDNLREPFVLVKLEGLMYREVAEILEVPVGTVQSRVHVAARRLRAGLSQSEEAGTAQAGGAKNGEENPHAL